MDKRKPELKIDNVIKRSKIHNTKQVTDVQINEIVTNNTNKKDSEIITISDDVCEDTNDEPLIQAAQKCPWCFDWLWSYDDLDIYNGNDSSYKGWISHKKCNKVENQT